MRARATERETRCVRNLLQWRGKFANAPRASYDLRVRGSAFAGQLGCESKSARAKEETDTRQNLGERPRRACTRVCRCVCARVSALVCTLGYVSARVRVRLSRVPSPRAAKTCDDARAPCPMRLAAP
eukprot:2388372-Pleurochrysis_carterae.AAC.1